MKPEIIQKEYNGIPVLFTNEAWFNATSIADKFNKRPVDWLRLDETKNYIEALNKISNVSQNHIWFNTKKGNNGGTWMHPDLAVSFARWLDINFSVWCDRQIKEILKSTINPVIKNAKSLDWKRERHQAASSFKVMNEVLEDARNEKGKQTAQKDYSNEARLINWCLFDKFEGVDRNTLDMNQLNIIAKLEVRNTRLIAKGLSYSERKQLLKEIYHELAAKQNEKLKKLK